MATAARVLAHCSAAPHARDVLAQLPAVPAIKRLAGPACSAPGCTDGRVEHWGETHACAACHVEDSDGSRVFIDRIGGICGHCLTDRMEHGAYRIGDVTCCEACGPDVLAFALDTSDDSDAAIERARVVLGGVR